MEAYLRRNMVIEWRLILEGTWLVAKVEPFRLNYGRLVLPGLTMQNHQQIGL